MKKVHENGMPAINGTALGPDLRLQDKTRLTHSILICGLLCYSIYLAVVITSNLHHMWDFKLRYWGALAYSKGLNPLEHESLKKTIGEVPHRPIFHVAVLHVGKEFALLPLFFRFYSMFLKLDIEALYYIFLAVKLTALNLLFYIWFRYIIPLKNFELTKTPAINALIPLLIIIFSWNRAIYMDVEAGNVSVFEQVFIWAGVAFYLKKRVVRFALCIVLASLWKIVPICFLSLLYPLITNRDERPRALVALMAGLGLFLLIHIVSFLLDPDIYTYYLGALARFSDEERGVVNPCIMALIGDGVDFLTGKNLISGELVSIKMYGIYSVVALAIGFLFFRTYFRQRLPDHPPEFVLFTFLTFGLLVPRFKDYSYMLLVPITLFLLKRRSAREERIMLLLLILSPPIFSYYPYLMIWLCFFFFIRSSGKLPAVN